MAGDGCSATCTTEAAGPTCDSCLATNCVDFQGVDLVAGCFTAVYSHGTLDFLGPTAAEEVLGAIRRAR